MENKTDQDIFLSYIPTLSVLHKAFALYISHIAIFILVMIIFWWISSKIFIGAIIVQTIVSSILSLYFIYIAKNGDKIREKYLKRYKELAAEKYWLKYQFPTMPFIGAAYYFPLLLINYDFLPTIVKLPSHFINNSIFPYYVSIPLGIAIIFCGFMIKRPSGGYGNDYDNYIYTIFPEKSKLITEGTYKFIRNPQYLGRGIMAIGFGVVANNISAILIGLIHFISYVAIIPAEDQELTRRYNEKFISYTKQVPVLFPKYGNWKKFIKTVFSR